MKIPSSVIIGGHTYQVIESDELLRGHDCRGMIHYELLQIGVDSNLPHSLKEEAVFHEITHGVFKHLGLDSEDEVMIHRISAALYDVLKSNKLYFGLDDDKGGKR